MITAITKRKLIAYVKSAKTNSEFRESSNLQWKREINNTVDYILHRD